MATCNCPMRYGAHEWHCGKVGEYDYVHCHDCDTPIWMCAMSLSRCREGRAKYESSEEYAESQRQSLKEFLKRRVKHENT